MTEDANTKALAALNALKAGFGPNDVISALNLTVINFPTGKADFPGFNRAVLNRAAAVLKQLPANMVIEVRGHTDNVAMKPPNLCYRSSERRQFAPC